MFALVFIALVASHAAAQRGPARLTLYFQNESPGKDRQANWLPAPKGEFIAMIHVSRPREVPPSILDGGWKPPAVEIAH